jgi:hypothetical protein
MKSMSICRRDLISNLVTLSIVFSGIIFACTKSPKIETVKKVPAGVENFNDSGETDWIPDYDDTATMLANIPKETLSKYVNTNQGLEYSFEFLTLKKKGDIVFNGEYAQIEIDGIPIGQAGTLKIEILEEGTAKLAGSKDNVTFKKGKNNQSVDLKKVEGNDDNGNTDDKPDDSDQDDEPSATLILTLNIKDSQSDDQNDESSDSGGGNNFTAKILPLARSYCNDCHSKIGLATPDNEEYFAARKSSLTARLSKSASNTMPQRGSQEAQRMSDEDRDVLISYIKSL